MRFTVERVQKAYDKLKWAPVAGVYTAGRREIGGQSFFLACPVCTIVKAEYNRFLGPKGDWGYQSLDLAAHLTGNTKEYVKSFMTAYDKRDPSSFVSSDSEGYQDGKKVREHFPPVLQK